MSLEGMSEQEIQELQSRLISALRVKGGSAGNSTMIRELRFQDEQIYWIIRDRLIDAGRLELGRGRGGSIRLLEDLPMPVSTQAASSSQTLTPREEELYEPFSIALKSTWTLAQKLKPGIVEITAKQGKRETGGKWSRPDLTVVGLKIYTYLPGKFLDVSTFEVKPAGLLDVTAVYEALAHRRAAHRSYVLVKASESERKDYDSAFAPAVEEAQRHGIGFIVAAEPSDYATWEEEVEAVRFEPSPDRLNQFIALQLSDGTKEEIIQWFKA